MHPSLFTYHSRRVFSGIQPTGILHIGNYIGAVKNWLTLQETETSPSSSSSSRHSGSASVHSQEPVSSTASPHSPSIPSSSSPTLVAGATATTGTTTNDRTRCIFSIVDLHAMTMPYDPEQLEKQVYFMTSTLLACGLDPQRVLIYAQSHVREHTELAWILSCITPLGWLQRMTQFKTKIQQTSSGSTIASSNTKEKLNDKKVSSSPLGLLSYPVLQTADIVLYKATHVPVGEDQYQHLELARDICTVFNNRYRCNNSSMNSNSSSSNYTDGTPGTVNTPDPSLSSLSSLSSTILSSDSENNHPLNDKGIFPLPQTLSLPIGARIMSLRDGTKKMSKSDKDDNNRINLNDSPETIQQKIKIAKTDTEIGFGKYDPIQRPEKANLLSIYSSLSGKSIDELCRTYQTSSAVQFKNDLTDVIIQSFRPIQNNLQQFTKEPEYIHQVLQQGAEQAREVAAQTMKEVRQAVGYR